MYKAACENLKDLVAEALREKHPTLFVTSEPRDIINDILTVARETGTPYRYVPFATIKNPQELEEIDDVVVVDASRVPYSSYSDLFSLEGTILIVADLASIQDEDVE